MKKYTYTGLLAVALLAGSCSDDFFDLKPSDSVVTNQVYKTAGDFDVAVVGCYAKLQTQFDFYTDCCEYRSDNLFLSAPTSGTQDRYDIDHFVTKPSNGILSEYWANFNNNVYRCNLVINKIDNANIDDKLKSQYKAEAMFIRTLNYFNMYRVWGGVPTTRVAVNAEEARTIKRSSDEEMLNLMAGDLEEIINNKMLPESYSSTQTGRATLGAAMALLGKVYLTFHEWDKAKNVLSKLIGKYELLSNVEDVFNVENKWNKEIIFSVRYNKDIENQGHGLWFNLTNKKDETNQTEALLNSFSKGDVRKELISYEKIESKIYLMNKFKDIRSETFNRVGNDYILLRYADVLLMYAEALNEASYDSSPSSEALKYLNEIRTRAKIDPLTNNDVPNQERFRKAILDERQKEFPYEGQRWFDLVRMGYAKEAIKSAENIDIEDYQFVFPIPQVEIEKVGNTDVLWQNPGY